MSNRGKTLVKGHALLQEGWPYRDEGMPREWRDVNPALGHGKCSCGATGPLDYSNAARKRWHQLHKQEVKEKENNG